jgi:hypothetical protein
MKLDKSVALATLLRRTIVILAVAVGVGSSVLPMSALARGDGGRRIARHDCGRDVGDRDCGYVGYASSLPAGCQGCGQRDVWGHWGAYYGPMVQVR